MLSQTIRLYPDREEVTLTTYIVRDAPQLLNGKNRPAVLICPGGAYMHCTPREAEPVALKFASMGYHAFVLVYSTYSEGKPPKMGGPLVVKPTCQYPNPLLEVAQAMLLIHEHAEEWHVDTERIAVCGFSAGAHNAAMYLTNWDKEVVAEHFPGKKEQLRPAAGILGYMLSDYLYMKEKTAEQGEGAAGFFQVSNVAYFGVPMPSDEVLVQVSPARNVSESTPPIFLWATAADESMPVQNSLRMAHALADRKIPFELHIFEEGPHGLSLATQASAGAKAQIYPDAAKWTDLAAAWLEKRFALDLP